MTHAGELAALATAIFWTFTSLSFELASKRVGSLVVNLYRLILALVFYTVFGYLWRGIALPIDAPMNAWIWLPVSGLVGFVIGDYFLFRAFAMVGARVGMLIMSLAPPIAAISGFLILNERLSLMNLFGMALTLFGIIMVVMERGAKINGKSGSWKLSHSPKGIFYAFIGAAGQGIGLVLSKLGMGNYDAFASSQIRVMAGLLGFVILFAILRRWGKAYAAIQDKKALKYILIGAFFGPFLGVAFSLISVKYTQTGIGSTIMALVPVIIIPFAWFFLKEKIRFREVLGAIIAVSGVMLFFLF